MWVGSLILVGHLDAQMAEYQPKYLFTTLFIGIAEQSGSDKGFVEYDDQQLPQKVALYDAFSKKSFPEISARRYCAFMSDKSKNESLEDSGAALLGHLDALRLRCNETGIEPIIQCEISGDRAAEIFLACIALSQHTDFPHSINTASFYDISDATLNNTMLASLLIRHAYFFMPKNGVKVQLNNQQKDLARVAVLCDTMPKAIAQPWWVLAPVFLRHLWVLASPASLAAEISLSTFLNDSAVLVCGRNKIDVSNALFPVLKSSESGNQKNGQTSGLFALLASLQSLK